MIEIKKKKSCTVWSRGKTCATTSRRARDVLHSHTATREGDRVWSHTAWHQSPQAASTHTHTLNHMYTLAHLAAIRRPKSIIQEIDHALNTQTQRYKHTHWVSWYCCWPPSTSSSLLLSVDRCCCAAVCTHIARFHVPAHVSPIHAILYISFSSTLYFVRGARSSTPLFDFGYAKSFNTDSVVL